METLCANDIVMDINARVKFGFDVQKTTPLFSGRARASALYVRLINFRLRGGFFIFSSFLRAKKKTAHRTREDGRPSIKARDEEEEGEGSKKVQKKSIKAKKKRGGKVQKNTTKRENQSRDKKINREETNH